MKRQDIIFIRIFILVLFLFFTVFLVNILNKEKAPTQMQVLQDQIVGNNFNKLFNDFSRSPEILKKENLKTFEYKIVNNPGAGDCLFYCFKFALQSIGKNISIKKLREIVAYSINEELYLNLKLIFDNAKRENDFDIIRDFQFVENCNNLSDLRNKILKSSYFGDEISLNSFEEKFKIQPVILIRSKTNGKFKISKRIKLNEKKLFIFLFLENIHYQIFQINKRFVFKGNEIEEFLKYFL
tara:strand:+ start:1594 stop:2313 length:720 start_codon:yes stop_codon:yes gene_type:complete